MRVVSEGVKDNVRKLIERRMQNYVGYPLNNEVIEALRYDIHGALLELMRVGEVLQFDPDEIRVSVDPWDPSMIRVRIGSDNAPVVVTGPRDTMEPGKGTE